MDDKDYDDFVDDDIDDIDDIDEEEEDEDDIDNLEDTTNADSVSVMSKHVESIKDYQGTIITKNNTYSKLYEANYKTLPILTKYEKARLIGIRATQIANGAQTTVDTGDIVDNIEKAKKEMDEGKFILAISRRLPTTNPRKPKEEIRRLDSLIN